LNFFLRLSFDHLSVACSFHLIKFYFASQIHVWNSDTPEPAANEDGSHSNIIFNPKNAERSAMRCSMLPKIICNPGELHDLRYLFLGHGRPFPFLCPPDQVFLRLRLLHLPYHGRGPRPSSLTLVLVRHPPAKYQVGERQEG